MLLELAKRVSLGVLLEAVACAGQTSQPDPLHVATETVTKYCTGCHNARLKTGGLVLDPATL